MKKETLFNPYYIAIPIVLGLSVIGGMFWKEFNPRMFASIRPDAQMWFGIILAVLFMVCQNLALTQRFKILVGKKLSWKQVFRVNMLCEFTSAATPSAVGGSSLIAVYLHKEGLAGGEGTSIMIANLFLDELFLSLACLVVLALYPMDTLFMSNGGFDTGVQIVFLIVLAVICLWTFVLYIALFHKAVWVSHALKALFSLPFLRRWRSNVDKLGEDLVVSSRELSKRSLTFWLKCFGVTAWAWCSRYWVVNALLFAFSTGGDHFLAFARQLVIWMVLVVTPTPGGSGFGEYMFKVYYGDFFTMAGTAVIAAFVWRLITYYSYLIIGVCILPQWVNSTFGKQKQDDRQEKG